MKTKARFRIVDFTNRGGSQSSRVSGCTADGSKIGRNFSTMTEATLFQQALESEYLGLPKQDGELVSTRLNKQQIAEAELAFHQLTGGPLLPAIRFHMENFREPIGAKLAKMRQRRILVQWLAMILEAIAFLDCDSPQSGTTEEVPQKWPRKLEVFAN